MTVTRRYPFGPLAKAMGLSPNQAAKALGLGGYSQKEYRRIGMSELVADRLAVRVGLHPASIWPEWVADHAADMADAYRARKAKEARRRYRRDPKYREAQKARRATYYAECGDYERARARDRYWADPEAARRKRTARRRTARLVAELMDEAS